MPEQQLGAGRVEGDRDPVERRPAAPAPPSGAADRRRPGQKPSVAASPSASGPAEQQRQPGPDVVTVA